MSVLPGVVITAVIVVILILLAAKSSAPAAAEIGLDIVEHGAAADFGDNSLSLPAFEFRRRGRAAIGRTADGMAGTVQ
jgi:hypothetical protein